LLARAILHDAFTRIETKVNDIFDCFMFKEDCVDHSAIVVPPFLHVLLKLALMNFNLLDL
jgi:hypothetical protein